MTYTRRFSKTIHVPVKVEYKEFEFITDSKGDVVRDFKGDFKIKKVWRGECKINCVGL